jgi:hypothetical protein
MDSLPIGSAMLHACSTPVFDVIRRLHQQLRHGPGRTVTRGSTSVMAIYRQRCLVAATLVQVAMMCHVQGRYRSPVENASAPFEPPKTQSGSGELLALQKLEFRACARLVWSRSSRVSVQAIQSKCLLPFRHPGDVRSQKCGRYPLLRNSSTIRSLPGRAFHQYTCPVSEVRELPTRPHHLRNSRD